MRRRRLVFFTACLFALGVLQLQASNVQPNTEPLTVEIEGPQAGMLGQTVTFSASVSDGSAGSGNYTYQWNIDGQDKGTGASLDYTVPAGDSDAKEVTVKCTVTDSEGESEPGEIQFWQVKITLKRDGTEISGTPEVWAGQKMSLSAHVVPSGLGVKQHDWVVPQRCIADYIMTPSKGYVIQCTSDNFTSPNITFFWVDGTPQGVAKSVTYKATVASSELAVSQKFVVRTPDCAYDLSPLAEVACDTDWHTLMPGYIALHLGNLNPPGFAVELKTYLPSGHSHKWVQLVRGDRIWQSPAGMWLQICKRGLDFMYDFIRIEDSPCLQVLWLSFEMQAEDYMTTVLLYRPPGESIYVPLHAVHWGWFGTASRTGSRWTLDCNDKYRGQMMTWPFHPVW